MGPKSECNQHQSNEETIKTSQEKENVDLTIMGARKKRKTSKKMHNLSKNISKNKQN